MALFGITLLIGVGVAGPAVAVGGLEITELTDSEVSAGSTVDHTLAVEADEISADGSPDVVYVTLPNTYAGNVSFSTVAFQNRTSGETVPISSSTSVVDGLDDDGVQETLRTEISHDASYETDELNATYQFSLTHPSVTEETSYPVTFSVADSSTGNGETTAMDAITVTPATDGAGGTTADGTTDSMDAVGSDADGTDAVETDTTASNGSGPGFTAGVALLALLALAALAGWRE
jgi:PGF-CTERM protein